VLTSDRKQRWLQFPEILLKRRELYVVCVVEKEFATENKDLLKGKGHVLKEYYTDETLKSDLARKIFILPDRSLAPAKENGLRK
jgi:hypothetical protein